MLAFIKKAPDNIYLFHKVVLVMGVFGGLRREEMVKMSTKDITDKGSVLIVKVPETKTGTSKGFTIVEETEINALKLVRKYMALRPNKMNHGRFFVTYRMGRCTVQPVGKNTLGSVPNVIAKYLKLDNPQQYTGHCLRRTSSTLLIEAGASFETLKMHGKWKSNTVAQNYVEESITSKNRISNLIASAVTSTESNAYKNDCKTRKISLTNLQTTPDVNIQKPGSSSNYLENEKVHNSENCCNKTADFSGTFQNCNFYFAKQP